MAYLFRQMLNRMRSFFQKEPLDHELDAGWLRIWKWPLKRIFNAE